MLSTKTDRRLQIEGLAPQECGFATFSLKIHSYSWGTGMDSNSWVSVEHLPCFLRLDCQLARG